MRVGRSGAVRMLAGRRAAVAAVVAGVAAVGAGAAGLNLAGGGSDRTTLPTPAIPAAAPSMLTAQVPQRLAPPRRAGAIRAPTISRLARSPAGYWTPPPAALSIPSIAVNARLTRLGITTAGAIEVPTDPAVPGWYTRSPKPGAIGSSIILGHFDSRSGPAVFYHLGRLRPGERILIRRTDGSRTVFRVVLVQAYDKDHFPTAAVYGPTPDAELRLVTCGGVFDQRVRSYLSNVVVYATVVR